MLYKEVTYLHTKMSSLIFAQAKAIYRKQEKYKDILKQAGQPKDIIDKAAEAMLNSERERFRDILTIAQLLTEDYCEVTNKSKDNHFFITIRPKDDTPFETFYALIYKFVNRAFMISYTLSFEQKDPEGSGKGYHAHIVCDTKHRSKGECLRDTKSTFSSVCEPNCIEVKPTRNPDDIINNYMIAYHSDDGHKEVTQNGDKLWRDNMKLEHIYYNNLPQHYTRSVIKSGTDLNCVITFD